MLYAILIVLGIITLVKGRLSVTRNRAVTGWPAYVAGVLLLLPLPVSFMIGLVVGIIYALNNPETPLAIADSRWLFLIDLSAMGVAVLLVVLIAVCFSKPVSQAQAIPQSTPAFPPNSEA